MATTNLQLKPVLKWVGGKTQLLEKIQSRFPREFGSYHEPFFGGGAVFFGSAVGRAFLSDVNKSLIDFYRYLQTDVNSLLEQTSALEFEFNSLGPESRKDWFYELRSEFNETLEPSVRRAASFLALNKTCFNGIYRENSKGKFNVPFNHGKGTVKFADRDSFYLASEKLQDATLKNLSFEYVLEYATPGDLVYFDPPYVPLTDTASFTGYSAGGFDIDLQKKLIDVAGTLKSSGVHVILSNSYVPWVYENYTKHGFEVTAVPARRLVSASAKSRAPVMEALIV
jgi:DNA adenine methylase